MENKYTPVRKCVCCRQIFPKSKLIRIVMQNNVPIIDFAKNLSGRGAYICDNEECLNTMEKKGSLSRAFKKKIPSEDINNLLEELKRKNI